MPQLCLFPSEFCWEWLTLCTMIDTILPLLHHVTDIVNFLADHIEQRGLCKFLYSARSSWNRCCGLHTVVATNPMQRDEHSLQSLVTCAAAWTSTVCDVAGVTF